mmetsp:Transcript_14108/g.45298  ORF Transcript_14108/g.45298 Transcript_14108/m.45298 type:complete len:285 (+) Transcript_14108:54-908(+)
MVSTSVSTLSISRHTPGSYASILGPLCPMNSHNISCRVLSVTLLSESPPLSTPLPPSADCSYGYLYYILSDLSEVAPQVVEHSSEQARPRRVLALPGVPLAAVRALALDALPQLDDEHVAPASGERRHAVELVRHKAERVALLKGVASHAAVGLERAELAAAKVAAVREHDVDRDERAGVVVRRVRQRASRLDSVVLDAARKDRPRGAAHHVPVLRVHLARQVEQPLAQGWSRSRKQTVGRQVRRLPSALTVGGGLVARGAARRAQERLELLMELVQVLDLCRR